MTTVSNSKKIFLLLIILTPPVKAGVVCKGKKVKNE